MIRPDNRGRLTNEQHSLKRGIWSYGGGTVIFVNAIALESADDVRTALQLAIEIEHATIPPYLTALWSLRNTNVAIANVIGGVVVEEMCHMALAANILNAVGGAPAFNDSAFVPRYPTGLPFHIGDKDGNTFDLDLAGFSIDLVRDTFMRIEEPNQPLVFPVKPATVELSAGVTYQTIGDFYRALAAKLRSLGPGIFTGDPARQVPSGVKDLVPVHTLADALSAIDRIVQQGEGTQTSPLDAADDDPAHYYRFASIVNGRKLVADPSVGEGYSYSGDLLPFEPSNVPTLITNPSSAAYANTPGAKRYSDEFDRQYTTLLNALHDVFNGHPDNIGNAIGMMVSCSTIAASLIAEEIEPNLHAAPVYAYSPA